MKKVKIISLLLVLAMAFSLCACSSEETTEQKEIVQFGTFGYNGAILTDYAVSAITATVHSVRKGSFFPVKILTVKSMRSISET